MATMFQNMFPPINIQTVRLTLFSVFVYLFVCLSACLKFYLSVTR